MLGKGDKNSFTSHEYYEQSLKAVELNKEQFVIFGISMYRLYKKMMGAVVKNQQIKVMFHRIVKSTMINRGHSIGLNSV